MGKQADETTDDICDKLSIDTISGFDLHYAAGDPSNEFVIDEF